MLGETNRIPSTISEVSLIFKGSPGSSFLAPRGVWISDRKLFVSDTGQNRVFIWNTIPASSVQPPDMIIGQVEETKTGRNANNQVSASSLQYPSGIWSNGHKLIVADAWNHRVLVWNKFPNQHGQPADVVIGQKDFSSNKPNVNGLNAPCSTQSLYWPYGVFSDDRHLWIADTGNRRVLYFKSIPSKSFTQADGVIGKPNFEIRDYDPQQPVWPYSVRINRAGNLAITDTQSFRILLWEKWQNALTGIAPDQIIGQMDIYSNGQNQFGLTPSNQSLNWCYDSFFHKDGILVSDTANSRIKWYSSLFDENNPKSSGLMGQHDYTTGSENEMNISGTDATLYWPFSLCQNEGLLAVADTGNHRVILNKLTI